MRKNAQVDTAMNIASVLSKGGANNIDEMFFFFRNIHYPKNGTIYQLLLFIIFDYSLNKLAPRAKDQQTISKTITLSLY